MQLGEARVPLVSRQLGGDAAGKLEGGGAALA